ncbi:AAA family ATPase [Neobacillus sp. YIM B06451]|uniref:AAA family ATPase n=1 Tax=Neobacillus sp. YIM B06451 TaxID=3070994 RepID=UPI00292CDE38|nr:AAA family ATPase [Neobacillus sp. YIM B06451]
MSNKEFDLGELKKSINEFIKEITDYTKDEDEASSGEIVNKYSDIMNRLDRPNIGLLKESYCELMDTFIEVLGKKQELLSAYSTYINKYFDQITSDNETINYFLGFKTFHILPIYWKVDENKYKDNLELKKQLDILKRCLSDESKNRLFYMFQNYYEHHEFNNFSDYSECIKDTVIIVYLSDLKYSKAMIESLVMSIGYAGTPGSIGYDFNGIRTIKNVFGIVEDLEFIEIILSRLASKLTYRRELTAEQINAIISAANIKFGLKKKYKFIYITAQIIDSFLKRAVYKLLPKNLEIDNDDDLEFMSDVNLPKLLSLNNDEYSFEVNGYEEGLEEKNVYFIQKNKPDHNKKLFSIREINERQFEIRWEKDVKTFSYNNLNDLGKFFQDNLKREFEDLGVGGEGEIKLIYFWFEKHNLLEDMALKFSDKYKVVFHNMQCKITPNPNELDSVLYDEKHDKVKMINAIVGKNGAGKTTLLDAFKYYFNNQSDENIFGKFFILYEDGDRLILRHNFNQNEVSFIAEIDSKRFKVMPLDKKNSGILSNTRILSYTSFVELSSFVGNEHDREFEGNHKDLSTYNDFRILERIKDVIDREGVKRQLVIEDSYKKLTLLSEAEALNTNFTEEIPIPYEILLTIELYKQTGSEKIHADEIQRCLSSKFTGRFTEKRIVDGKNSEIRCDLIYKIKIAGTGDFSFLYDFVKEEPNSYKRICTLDFLGLSSGQSAKLTLFSRLFFESDHEKVREIREALARARSYVKYFNKKDISSAYLNPNQNENLMILLDEGDMYFHPEWQKSFISDLKSLLNYAFEGHEIVKTIHLLITSNSPFIMSDIPLEHTIVLGKEYSLEQTYAQNIHDILKSSFFMYSGTLGEVAQKHIKELISRLQKEDSTEVDRHYIKRSINMIGEPMIRYKLESMYKKKFANQIQTEERIKQLEEELERLKKKEDYQR